MDWGSRQLVGGVGIPFPLTNSMRRPRVLIISGEASRLLQVFLIALQLVDALPTCTRGSNICVIPKARETRHNALAFCKRLIARSRLSSLGIVRLGRMAISLKLYPLAVLLTVPSAFTSRSVYSNFAYPAITWNVVVKQLASAVINKSSGVHLP